MISRTAHAGLALLLACAGDASVPPLEKEETSMDERAFMSLLHAVEHDRGAPYVEARDRPTSSATSTDLDRGLVHAVWVILGRTDYTGALHE